MILTGEPMLYRIIDLSLTNQQWQNTEAEGHVSLMPNQHLTSICTERIPERDTVTAEYRVGTVIAEGYRTM